MNKLALLALAAACSHLPTSTAPQALAAPTVVNLYNFATADGMHPRDSMVVGPDGALYGTQWTGALGGGAVFRFDPSSSTYTVLHAFTPLDATGRNPDGYGPVSPVAFGPDGRLYGTTRQGGTGGNPIRPAPGLFYSLDPANPTDLKPLHNFQTMAGFVDGATPSGGPVSDGHGGFYGCANTSNVWHWTPSSFAPLHQFAPINSDRTNIGGANPYGSPVVGADGQLYGWTTYGGKYAAGAVYAIDPATGAGHTVYDLPAYTFTGNTDNTPVQSPMLASDGAVYLATEFGGVNGTGLLLKIERTVTVIHEFGVYSSTAVPRFSNADGALPIGTLVEGADGWIYGTTIYGGANGTGAIYRFGKDGRSFQLVFSFGPAVHDATQPGCYPSAGLTRARDGALYGTTMLCGANGGGGVYKVTP